MKTCSCHCSIIPPHIFDEIEKHPEIQLKKATSELNSKFRIKRANKIIAPEAKKLVGQPGSAKRLVYDCKHETELRNELKLQEGGTLTSDLTVNTVYENVGIVRDFYKNHMNYNSIDNDCADLILNVHFSEDYNNAYWDGDEMIFGDGDNVIFTNFGNSLDVTGHELTHGVVQYTAGLIYIGQPGALNEHMADVFGVVIRQLHEGQTNNPSTANWLVGDTLMGPTLAGQAIRSMKEPGSAYNNKYMGKDPQPAHMNDFYTGSDDDYGVHINSGIPNKVFYLVSLSLNDTMKAALLWFSTLKCMRPRENFKSFKRKTLSKAFWLSIKGQLPKGTRKLVKHAFESVGI